MYVCASLARDLEVLRQPEGGDAVDDPEVDHLGDVALVLRQRGVIALPSTSATVGVDVFAALEGLLQLWARRRRGRGCAARANANRSEVIKAVLQPSLAS